jgi:HD superfamily phosphodiesterase
MTMTRMVKLEQIMRTLQLLLHNQSPAHDFEHIIRVYKNAEMISKHLSFAYLSGGSICFKH